jgi:uncharacterized protein YbjT (DUF2867 family)
MTLNKPGKVATVFGGSGFIGRRVVQALARAGYMVRVPTRKPGSTNYLRVSGVVGQVVPVGINLANEEAVRRVVAGAELVVNLVGILAENRKQKFTTLHAELPSRIASACAASGVRGLVHISALGASADSASAYARSKAAGEAAVLAAYPGAVILRPSVVFGPEDNFLNRFGQLAMTGPFLPLIGSGENRFQPVFVDDVAQAVMHALTSDAARGKTYELGGPRRYTFKQILEYINAETGRDRALVNFPFCIASFKAWFLERLPGQLLTRDQVTLLKSDNIVGDGALTLADLGINPTALEAIAPQYLYRYRKGGRFSGSKHDGHPAPAA